MSVKRIIAFFIGLATLITAGIEIYRFYTEHGGTVNMTLMNRQVRNNDERSIYICVSDDKQNLRNISVTPIFDNSSDYPIKDFDLRYQLEVIEGEAPEPMDLFRKIEIRNNTYQYKYNENVLPQLSQTYEPVRASDFPLKNGHYVILSKASFSGNANAYLYKVNLWIMVMPKRLKQSVEEWKAACQEQIFSSQPQADSFDKFYLCDGEVMNELGKDNGPVYYGRPMDSSASIIQKPGVKDKKLEGTNSTNVIPEKTSHSQVDYSENITQEIIPSEPIEILKYNYNDGILKLECKDIMQNSKLHYIVYHSKTSSEASCQVFSFYGNNHNVLDLPIGDYDEVDYVTTPKNESDLLKYVLCKEQNGRVILVNTYEKPLVVEFLFGRPYPGIVLLNPNQYITVTGVDSANYVNVVKTMTFEENKKPIHGLWWLIGIIIAGLLCHLIGKKLEDLDSAKHPNEILTYCVIVLVLIAAIVYFIYKIITLI